MALGWSIPPEELIKNFEIELATKVGNAIVLGVDDLADNIPKLTGLAANNVMTSMDTQRSDVRPVPNLSASESRTMARRVRARLINYGFRRGQNIYITNNVAYIVRLNVNNPIHTRKHPGRFWEAAIAKISRALK